jgi:hypothetical protein
MVGFPFTTKEIDRAPALVQATISSATKLVIFLFYIVGCRLIVVSWALENEAISSKMLKVWQRWASSHLAKFEFFELGSF